MNLKQLLPFIGLGYAATQDGITVTCEDDNTITVNIEYDNVAEILELEYGTCDKDSAGVKGADEQNSDNGWDLVFNVTACGMDSKLRTLEYNQTAKVRVGRHSGAAQLTMANFEIDSFCEYTATYTVMFDYGTLSTETHEFEESGGLIGLNIVIESYDQDFASSSSAATKAGKTIYLGMRITNEGVRYADDTDGESGKQFAPLGCSVNDTSNNLQYQLFDGQDSCSNDDVDFEISYDRSMHMWQFSHTLFLLGDFRTSSFELICEVAVCEAGSGDGPTLCDEINSNCGIVEEEDTEWKSESDGHNCTEHAKQYQANFWTKITKHHCTHSSFSAPGQDGQGSWAEECYLEEIHSFCAGHGDFAGDYEPLCVPDKDWNAYENWDGYTYDNDCVYFWDYFLHQSDGCDATFSQFTGKMENIPNSDNYPWSLEVLDGKGHWEDHCCPENWIQRTKCNDVAPKSLNEVFTRTERKRKP